MKIMHICQYYCDGFGYQENLLPSYQKKLGHDVVIVTSDKNLPFSKKVKAGIYEDNGIEIIRLKTKGEYKERFVWFMGLNQVLNEEQPDYIFHHGLTAPSLIQCALYKRKHPNVFLVADNHADYPNSGRYYLYRLIYYKFIWGSIHRVISDGINVYYSVTPSCLEFSRKEMLIPEEKQQLLFLGSDVNNQKFNECARDKIRERYGIKKNDCVAITVGKFDKNKKLDNLINAFRSIDIRGKKLMIVGSFTDPEYEQYVDNCIAEDNAIIKVGWVSSCELSKYFSASDFAVFPGGQSAVWQQAISCELPVIIKHWPGTEYLLNHDNGLFLFSDSCFELMQSMKCLFGSQELRTKMKENAKKVRDDLLSYSVIASKTLLDYEKRDISA